MRETKRSYVAPTVGSCSLAATVRGSFGSGKDYNGCGGDKRD